MTSLLNSTRGDPRNALDLQKPSRRWMRSSWWTAKVVSLNSCSMCGRAGLCRALVLHPSIRSSGTAIRRTDRLSWCTHRAPSGSWAVVAPLLWRQLRTMAAVSMCLRRRYCPRIPLWLPLKPHSRAGTTLSDLMLRPTPPLCLVVSSRDQWERRPHAISSWIRRYVDIFMRF